MLHILHIIKRYIIHIEKGYNESTVRKQVERVDHLDRSLLLKHSKPKRKSTIPFLLTYDLVLPNIQEIINKHRHILSINSSFKEIFNNLQPMTAFRKNTTKNVLHKQQPQVNVTHATPVDHFAATKFSKEHRLQALKPQTSYHFSPSHLQ